MENITSGGVQEFAASDNSAQAFPIGPAVRIARLRWVMRRMRLEIRPGAVLLVAALFWLANGSLWITLAILSSVLLHECGHAATAGTLGVEVKAMGLCTWGGYIRRAPAKDRRDALIALAGPLTSLALAGLLWPFEPWLAFVNLNVALFNLLPVSGTDGWRALSSMRQAKAAVLTGNVS